MKLARLKPYNGKTHVVRSFTVFGIKFLESRGWYQVDDDVAAYLKTCVQIQEEPLSTKAFDVVDDLEEAEEIDELEKRKVERALAAEAHPAKRVHASPSARRSAGDLTTGDLRAPAKKDAFDEQKDTFDEDMSAGRVAAPAVIVDGADDDDDAADEAPPPRAVIQSTPPKSSKKK